MWCQPTDSVPDTTPDPITAATSNVLSSLEQTCFYALCFERYINRTLSISKTPLLELNFSSNKKIIEKKNESNNVMLEIQHCI